MNYTISPVKSLQGVIQVPGDKSISHRALLLGAIADGTTRINGLSTSADVQSTVRCLQQLGAQIDKKKDNTLVHGVRTKGLSSATNLLDAGNSGTTLRLLSGILAAQPFTTVITGDDSLRNRPMGRIMKPLTQMGAVIECSPDGKAPLTIHGQKLRPIHYQSPIASAQVKSSILLAGLFTEGITSVTEPIQSRDHTERILPDFEVPVHKEGLTVSVAGKALPEAATIFVPGDISSAAFFIVAASIIPNSRITIQNIGLNPTRTGIIDVIQKMNGNITIEKSGIHQNEPLGDVTIQSSNLTGIEITPEQIPALIDEIPIIAVAASQANGKTIVSGAKELRVKESDRLKAITQNLQAMGITIEEKEDGFIIEGPQQLKGALIDSFLDHRIAMAFAIAGLIAKGKTTIRNPECVSISMPDFFDILMRLS